MNSPPASAPAADRPPLTWWKRWLFRLAALAIVIAFTEAIAWGCLWILTGTLSLEPLHADQDQLARGAVLVGSSAEAIHPYLGFVLNPETHPPVDSHGRQIPVNDLGFLDDERGIPRRAPGRLIVAVLGGSVASQVSLYADRPLLDELATRPEAAGKEIVLVRLALSGYKQPQQLMALNYMLSLGAEFDVVVNIDGYNEIALPTCENHLTGVFMGYPRMWHARMADVVDPREASRSYRLLKARAGRQQSAEDAARSPFRWTATRNLVWWARNESLDQAIADLGAELVQNERRQGRGFHSDGPVRLNPPESQALAQAADLWENGSRQLHRLCTANDIVYVHVLQPNQYLPGSKPIGPIEREATVSETQGYGKAVRHGYPLLIERGARLKDEGVRFADETQLFAEIEEQIYCDPFCHYNQRGNDLLAQAVARHIGDALAEQSTQAPPDVAGGP